MNDYSDITSSCRWLFDDAQKKLFQAEKNFDYTYACYRLIHFVIVQNDIKKQPFGLTLYKTVSPSCPLSGAISLLHTAVRLLLCENT